MKIVHVHSKNLQIFEDAVKDVGCYINGSTSARDVRNTLLLYNVRDVLGLIVFRKNLTVGCLKLIKEFDSIFEFSPRPIIVVCDDAKALFAEKKISVKHAPLYLVDSVGGTISDTDVNKIFTTLCCESGAIYDFSCIPDIRDNVAADAVDVDKMPQLSLSSSLRREYLELERGVLGAD